MIALRRMIAALLAVIMLPTAAPPPVLGQGADDAAPSLSQGSGVITLDQELLTSQAHASLTWDRLLPLGCLVYQTANPSMGNDDLPGLRLRLRLDLDAETFSAVVSGDTGFGELGAEASGRFRLVTQGRLTPQAGGYGWTLQGDGHVALGYAMTTTCLTSAEDPTPIVRSRRSSGGGAISIEGEIDLGIDTYALQLSATQGPADQQFRLWVHDVEVGEWEPPPIAEPSADPEADPAAEVAAIEAEDTAGAGADSLVAGESLDGRDRRDLGLFLLIVALAGGEELLVETLLEWTTAPYERYLRSLETIEAPAATAGPDHPDDLEVDPPAGALDLLGDTEVAAGGSADDASSADADSDPDAGSPDASPQPTTGREDDDAHVEQIAAALLDAADEDFRKKVEDAAHARRVVLVLQELLLPEPTEPADEGPAGPGPGQPAVGWLLWTDRFVPGPLLDPYSEDTPAEQVTTNLLWLAAHQRASDREEALVSHVMRMLEEDEWAYADEVTSVIVQLAAESEG